jgi:protein phosphatase PTC7
MAAMRPLKAIALLGLYTTPWTSACRVSPPLPSLRDWQQPQCSLYSTQGSSTTFSYRIAASFSAKGRVHNTKKDIYAYDPADPPITRNKARYARPASGQDAFFVSNIGNSGHVAFGVADGVGGWANQGVDPANFSHGLCGSMGDIAREVRGSLEDKLRPSELLHLGYDEVLDDPTIVAGGSTACVAVAQDNGSLEVAK